MQQRLTKTTVLAAAVLLVATVVTGLYLGVQTRRQFIEISESWSGYFEEADRKGALISSIRGHLGYGGIIHTFKNYVLRRDEIYLEQLMDQIENFEVALSAYLALPMSEAERAAILVIAETIDVYRSKIDVAVTAVAQNLSAEQIDTLVRVDDTAAIAGLREIEAILKDMRTDQSTRLIAAVDQGRGLIGIGFVSMALLVLAALFLAFTFWMILRQMRGTMVQLSQELVARTNLERREQRLAEAVEQSPATIMITDTAGHIEYVNRHFEELSGWSREEVIGQTPKFLQSGDTDAAEYQVMQAQLNDGKPWRGIMRNINKDGGNYWIESTILPLRGNDGATHSYLGIGEDITERLQAREQMVRAQKIEAVGLLAGGIAHDFNSVLTSILGAAHLAALDAPEGSDIASEINQIEIGARRAQLLVQQLLGFARRKAGNPVPTDLRAAISETLRLLEAATAPTTRFVFLGDGKPACVNADPTHLHQIVMNLCGNAAEAIGARSGCVEISLEDVPAPDVVQSHPESIRLRVRDDGPGMSEDVRRRVFDAFFTTKPLGKGTGLGLAVVYGLVTDMGGTIAVDSVLGQGATFTVTLPGCAAPKWSETDQGKVMPYGSDRLLIVDDEPEIAATLRRSLMRLGYQVEAFSSSRAALASFSTAPDRFDAVITDVFMPDLDGPALVRLIRQARPSLPVIFLTGFAPNIGPLDGPAPLIIAKPVDPVTLALRLRSHLDTV